MTLVRLALGFQQLLLKWYKNNIDLYCFVSSAFLGYEHQVNHSCQTVFEDRRLDQLDPMSSAERPLLPLSRPESPFGGAKGRCTGLMHGPQGTSVFCEEQPNWQTRDVQHL